MNTQSGAELRQARRSAGLSLATIAAVAGTTHGHLSRVERGEREVTPSLIDAYTRMCGTLMGGQPAPAGSTVDSMDRRNVLGVVAAAFMGGGATDPLVRLLDQMPSPALPTRVGASEVAAVEQASDLYSKLDLQFGGGLAAEVARGSLRWATALLGQQMSADTELRLRSAVGSLADRVAWARYDAGDQASAHAMFLLALNTAAGGGDPDLRGHVILDLSTLTADSGRPHESVEMMRLALGDERMSDTERSNLHAVCARHCASVGDQAHRQAAVRHMALAEEALDRADVGQAPPWARRVTAVPGHFDSAFGLALFELGDDESARARFGAALRGLGPGRVRTGLRCRARLAVLCMRAGDPDEATEHALRAVNDAGGVRSARVTADLRMVREQARRYGLAELAGEVGAALT